MYSGNHTQTEFGIIMIINFEDFFFQLLENLRGII